MKEMIEFVSESYSFNKKRVLWCKFVQLRGIGRHEMDEFIPLIEIFLVFCSNKERFLPLKKKAVFVACECFIG